MAWTNGMEYFTYPIPSFFVQNVWMLVFSHNKNVSFSYSCKLFRMTLLDISLISEKGAIGVK